MENEQKMVEETKEEKVAETQNVEEPKKEGEEPNKQVEDTKKVEETKEETKEEEKSEDNGCEGEDCSTCKNCEEENKVNDTEQSGNGIALEDLVTKDYLTERFASFEAKLDAIIKENADLKEANAKLREKYEENDFGDYSRKGIEAKDDGVRNANDTFDNYAKQFM